MFNVLVHHPYLLLAFFGLAIGTLGAYLLFESNDGRLRQQAWEYGARRTNAYRRSYWSVAFLFALIAGMALWNIYEDTGKRFAEIRVPAMVKDLNKGLEVARLEGERITDSLEGASLIQYNTSLDSIIEAVIGFSCFKDHATGKLFLMPLDYTPEKVKEALTAGTVIYSSRFSKDRYVLASMVEDPSWVDAQAIEKRGMILFYAGMFTLGIFLTFAGSFLITAPIYYFSLLRIKSRTPKSRP